MTLSQEQLLELRLQASEARIRTLLETIPVGFFITDQAGVIELASPACLELFNCSYSDLHRRNLQEIFLLEKTTVEEFLFPAQKQARELTARRADGSEFPATIKVSTYAKTPTTMGLLVVVEDISAKREVERMKQEFISMVTHDLRTPLTSVAAFLTLITEGVFDENIAKMKLRAAGVESDVSRLISMISNLLNLHKLEAGRLSLCPEVMPISNIIHRSLQSVSEWAEKREVPLEIANMPEKLFVTADGDYTIQVLVNLLSNAVKFSPKGSAVTVSVEANNSLVKIMVIDRGRGIPHEFQSRLFNRFEQARLSDARVEGGSGLGLAISKAIIEEQGGAIGVDSEPGNGCVFWFTLPKAVPN